MTHIEKVLFDRINNFMREDDPWFNMLKELVSETETLDECLKNLHFEDGVMSLVLAQRVELTWDIEDEYRFETYDNHSSFEPWICSGEVETEVKLTPEFGMWYFKENWERATINHF